MSYDGSSNPHKRAFLQDSAGVENQNQTVAGSRPATAFLGEPEAVAIAFEAVKHDTALLQTGGRRTPILRQLRTHRFAGSQRANNGTTDVVRGGSVRYVVQPASTNNTAVTNPPPDRRK